jgi:hypothetical protein
MGLRDGICGRCAEWLPCRCLRLARAELVSIRAEALAERSAKYGPFLVKAREAQWRKREARPLYERALRARGSWQS